MDDQELNELINNKDTQDQREKFFIKIENYILISEQISSLIQIENNIVDVFQRWLPFVELKNIEVNNNKGVNQATINIGTIGHVAHGKSTFVKAVSGIDVF